MVQHIVADAHEVGRGDSRYLAARARNGVEDAYAGRFAVGAGDQGNRNVVNV